MPAAVKEYYYQPKTPENLYTFGKNLTSKTPENLFTFGKSHGFKVYKPPSKQPSITIKAATPVPILKEDKPLLQVDVKVNEMTERIEIYKHQDAA